MTARFCDMWGEPLIEQYDEDEETLTPLLRRLTTLREAPASWAVAGLASTERDTAKRARVSN